METENKLFWVALNNARKNHIFQVGTGKSLCMKWGYFRDPEKNGTPFFFGTKPLSDDCVVCCRRANAALADAKQEGKDNG